MRLGNVLFLLWCLLDATHLRAQDNDAQVIYGDGFYNEERLGKKTWHWMADEGTVRLKNERRDMILTLVGRAPLKAMDGVPSMSVFVNGQELERFTPPKDVFEKTYALSAAKLGAGDWIELRVTISKVVVPSERDKANTDGRRLGLQLFGLSWEPMAGAAPPPAEQAAQPFAQPTRSGKGTLAIALVGGVAFSLAVALGLGTWLFLRQRNRPTQSALSAVLSLACPECGKKLKVKAELAGNKVKCPQCGEAVLVTGGTQSEHSPR